MIEIKIPKEITEYKEKFLFGLTVRQCVSVAAALAICVPLYIFGKDIFGADITAWLVMIIAVPVFGFGFIKFGGMTFEKFVAVLFRQKFAEPQRRKYVELPVFYEWREEIISNEITRQTALAERKRKKEKVQEKVLPKKTEPKFTSKSGANNEVEIPVFGVGSLNVKWNKKGCNYENKHKRSR